MNTYEQLLLNDKAELERKISSLIEDQLSHACPQANASLNDISKVINFTYAIEATCSFQMDYPSITGQKIFSSIEDYVDRDHHYEYLEEAEQDEVEWDDDFDFCGTFGWDNTPTVNVRVEGLTQDSSIEAKKIWTAQTKQQSPESLLALIEEIDAAKESK